MIGNDFSEGVYLHGVPLFLCGAGHVPSDGEETEEEYVFYAYVSSTAERRSEAN